MAGGGRLNIPLLSDTIVPSEQKSVSFRDPAGQLFRAGDRILRVIDKSACSTLEAFLASKAAAQFSKAGMFVQSRPLELDEARRVLSAARIDLLEREIETVLEHERILFPSFPYEWPPEMLAAAGNLTLDIAETLIEEGFGLKDATPYNVLFRGPRPVFVDILSAEPRDPNDPTWLPYAQFVRTFVLPLVAHRFCGVPLSAHTAGSRDGIEPEKVYRLLSFFARLRSPALTHVTLPTWLAKRTCSSNAAIYCKKSTRNPSQARFVLRSMFRTLRRSLKKAAGPQQVSRWTQYVESHSYSAQAFETKRIFVERALTDFPAPWVLDMGCNTGFYSVIAAKKRSCVVAIDSDPSVVGALWSKASHDGLDILPLVVDLARPSPATGWRNQECPSFLERCRGRFDAVLMLAFVHHLMATEGIPLSEIFRLGKDLTRNLLLVEYIDPADPMFKQLVRGREALFQNLTREAFEASGRRFFDIVRSQQLGTTRYLYVLAKKKL